MRHRDESSGPEVDPIGAIRQYPAVVVGFTVVFAVIGMAFALRQAPVFVASAGLVVADARSSSIFEASSGDAERYVADQVAILKSRVIAERASALAPTLDPGREISPEDFLSNVSISFDPDSSFLGLSFEADDRVTAQVGANAMGASYREVISAAIAQDAETAVGRLDEAIAATVAKIEALQVEIDALRVNDAERAQLDADVAQIVSDLAELRRQGSLIPSGGSTEIGLAAIAEITAKAEQLAAELQARLLVTEVEGRFPATALLLLQQRDASSLLSELTLQRSQIEVDAQLAGNGIAFFAPAGLGRARGISTTSAVLVSTILGLVLGSGVAFWLSQRRRRIGDRLEPRRILGVPLLAEVPRVEGHTATQTWFERLRSRVMNGTDEGETVGTKEDPTSPRAESFRVLAASIQRRIAEWRAAAPGEALQRGMVVAIVAPVVGEGTSVLSVNTAMAAARAGLRVVLVDADAGAQEASRLIPGVAERTATVGLAEVAAGTSSLGGAVVPVEIGSGARLSVLGRGSTSFTASDYFSSPAVADVLVQLADRYDLVMLDLPPLLQVAYSSAAIQQADAVVLVVRHGSATANLDEARHRLDLIGIPMLGYVYFDALTRQGIGPASAVSTNGVPTEPSVTGGTR